jgi:type I restriction enzyme S subunit
MSSVNSCEWIELKIGEVAEVVAGGTPKASNPDNFKASGTGIAWLTPADLSGYTRKKISFGARDLSNQGYNSSSAKILPKGSLLFSSRAPIGYVAIAQNDISTNQGFKSFVFPYGVDSDYAYYYLRSIKDLAESLGTGTTFKELSGITAKKLPFLLPPLAEQKTIADKLDTLLAQVESTKVRLECVPNILKTFRQSILVAAVSGKLTEEWRNNNNVTPVHETVEKIETARQLVITGKAKKAQAHLKEEEYVIPNTWKWVSLDSLSKKITDGTHHTPTYTESGIHFISVKDIRNGEIDFSDTKYISEKEHLELSKRCPVEVGDLLITKSGTIGRTAIVKTNIEFSLFVSVALIKPASNEVNTKFIDISLQKWVNEIDVSSRIVGSAIKNLHLRDIKVLAIPFAPKEEQAEIVRRVEELFAFANSIEQKINSALDLVNTLPKSILTKAFRGELTADWRAANPDLVSGDNSAKALLEKIMAERKAIEKWPKPKRSAIKEKTGSRMSKQIIKVAEALKQAGKPLSGQQLLVAAGYPNDSSTDQLESFFLDIRNALNIDKSIFKLERGDDGQDWFNLAKATTNE